MNVDIGTEAPIFLFWEYLLQIFGILSLQCDVLKRRWTRTNMSPAASSSEPTGGILILACGGIMKRKIVFIETWSDYAPFGYRCRGGRWLMGTWALPIGQ